MTSTSLTILDVEGWRGIHVGGPAFLRTRSETFDIPPHARAFFVYNDGRLFQTYNARRASQWHLHSMYSSPYWSRTYRIHGKSLPTAVVAKAKNTVSCS